MPVLNDWQEKHQIISFLHVFFFFTCAVYQTGGWLHNRRCCPAATTQISYGRGGGPQKAERHYQEARHTGAARAALRLQGEMNISIHGVWQT
jgi:hypothetical protein